MGIGAWLRTPILQGQCERQTNHQVVGIGMAAWELANQRPDRRNSRRFHCCLAGHAEPRATGLCDRRKMRVTRNIVERISI